jgi:hypothetical protein
MENNKKIEEDKELDNVAKKIFDSFLNGVKKEQDLSNILLKGHLCIENFLDELIAIFDLNKGISVHRESFSGKLKKLQEYIKNQKGSATLENTQLKSILPSLFALNEARNSLAHNFNFNLSESDINRIGVNLGSSYILNKYVKGHKELRENLLFCLKLIIKEVGSVIYLKICDIKDKREQIQNKI